MISIIVQQPPGDFEGPQISDPLIVSEAQARAKGRSQILKNHKDRLRISGTCSLQPFMAPGAIVLYTDRQGKQHRCLLRQSALTITRQSVEQGGGFSAKSDIVMEYIKDEDA